MQFADIILPLNIPKPLTYGIPLKWQGKLIPGMRVEVNMGKNRTYAGIVWKIHSLKPDSYQIKPIKNIIDDIPIITTIQLQFWEWIAQYYLCSLGEVMNAALPAHLKLMSESILIWANLIDEIPVEFEEDVFLLAEALQVRKKMTISECRELLNNKNPSKAINQLLEYELISISDLLEERYKPKLEKFVFLEEQYNSNNQLNELFNSLNNAPKQLKLLMGFLQMSAQSKAVNYKDLLAQTKVSASVFSSLLSKGIFKVEEIPIDRLAFLEAIKKNEFKLTALQQQAVKEIRSGWENKKIALLHGITGSGKTLCYIELIKDFISQGKQCLFLLPEIALTTQVVRRLRSYFGEELGVYHSRFSNNERVEIWNKVKENKYKIILGARSAIWLPFQTLGLIIVDEEHETSYKQHDPAPRFHARDSAIILASFHQANVVLGSATPALESALNAQRGKYAYISLKERYLGVSLPEISIVSAKNMQLSLSNIMTLDLLKGIQETIKSGQQVILFQNKRGYSPFLMCSSCGWVAHCKHCSVSLTYHKSTDKLHCHYCSTRSSPIKHCPQCGQFKMTSKSFGTERIEEDLKRIFPKLKVARMDWDTMAGKNKHAQLIDNFEKGRIDILVGTQMVVKGLDFDHVGLVGILSSDNLLSFPDFRVNERAFQMMEQVSGRAGRVDGRGKVIIQAYNLKHPVLEWVKNHDYKSFYHQEISARQEFAYPPFSRIIKISIKHRDEEKSINGSVLLADQLRKISGLLIQGPGPAIISKVRNLYIQEILLKLPLDAQKLQMIKFDVSKAVNSTLSTRGYSTLQISIDVDSF